MKFSSLQRLYIQDKIDSDRLISLNKDHSHYLINVLRLKNGDKVRIFNQNDGEYIASIINHTKKSCDLKIENLFRPPLKEKNLCIIQSIIKSDKMMQILDMTTQLGITEIAPVISERTQIKTINKDKYLKTLIESTEQCERMSIPILHDVSRLGDFLDKSNFDIIFLANEMEENTLLSKDLIKNYQKIAFIIGPEGGFTNEEINVITSYKNVVSITLGKTVLRAETAAVSITAQIQLLRD